MIASQQNCLFLALGLGGALAAWASGWGMYLAMGLGLLAVGGGLAGFRRPEAPGGARLAAASAAALGGLSVLLAVAKYALTLAAVSALVHLVG